MPTPGQMAPQDQATPNFKKSSWYLATHPGYIDPAEHAGALRNHEEGALKAQKPTQKHFFGGPLVVSGRTTRLPYCSPGSQSKNFFRYGK
jgi:hypothetical protein